MQRNPRYFPFFDSIMPHWCAALVILVSVCVFAPPAQAEKYFFGNKKGEVYPSQEAREQQEHAQSVEKYDALIKEQQETSRLLNEMLIQQTQTNSSLTLMLQKMDQQQMLLGYYIKMQQQKNDPALRVSPTLPNTATPSGTPGASGSLNMRLDNTKPQ